MQVTRRGFVSGLSVSGALALTGFAGEIRPANNAGAGTSPLGLTDTTGDSKPARILFNENPLGPSPSALAALQGSMEEFSRYPLGRTPRLENKLRKRLGMPFAELPPGLSLRPTPPPEGDSDLLLGVGSSEILRAIAWAYCSQGGTVIEAYPGYSALGAEAVNMPGSKASRILVPLDAKNRIDTDGMLKAIDSDTKVIVVCNPNNPTGTALGLAEIEKLADATPADALLLVDEAYIEFLDDQEKVSAIELAKERKNVLVARTFSKIYGLAGLRIGYGVSSTEVIDRLKPYMLGRLSLSMPGVIAADAALDDEEHLAATRDLSRKVIGSWEREFAKYGWSMAHSQTCFGWVDVGEDCSALVKFLGDRDVLISGGQRWELPNCVRISVGTEEENDRLLAGVAAFKRS